MTFDKTEHVRITHLSTALPTMSLEFRQRLSGTSHDAQKIYICCSFSSEGEQDCQTPLQHSRFHRSRISEYQLTDTAEYDTHLSDIHVSARPRDNASFRPESSYANEWLLWFSTSEALTVLNDKDLSLLESLSRKTDYR